MSKRWPQWSTVGALGLLLFVGLVPVQPSSASCAAAYFEDVESQTGTVVRPGATVNVDGQAFFASGCADPPGSVLSSCSREEPVAYQDVPLFVKQGRRVWELGRSETEDDRAGHLSWQVRLPADLHPGEAILQARLDSSPAVTDTIRIKG